MREAWRNVTQYLFTISRTRIKNVSKKTMTLESIHTRKRFADAMIMHRGTAFATHTHSLATSCNAPPLGRKVSPFQNGPVSNRNWAVLAVLSPPPLQAHLRPWNMPCSVTKAVLAAFCQDCFLSFSGHDKRQRFFQSLEAEAL